MYARLQIFIQLSPTLTKLCHIKHHYIHVVHITCTKCPKRAKTDRQYAIARPRFALKCIVR